RRRLRAGGYEHLDVGFADLVTVRPRGELGDLGGEVDQVLSDQLDEEPAGLRPGARAFAGELFGDPPTQLAARCLVDDDVAGLRARFRQRGLLLDPLAD